MKDFKCHGCKAVLGTTDGLRLTINKTIFPLKVTMICGTCGESNQWRPLVDANHYKVVCARCGNSRLRAVHIP